MQEPLLRPVHPGAFGFGPMPMGFVDRRLCSPTVLLPCGDGRFYAGGFTPGPMAFPRGDGPFHGGFTPSPRASPRGDGRFYGGGHTPFTPSPTRASPRGATSPSTPSSSSGSRVDDDAATEHRLRMARFALQYQDAANRYHLCVSQLADAAREADELRAENADLRVANSGLAGRFVMLGGNQCAALALAQQLRRLHPGQMQVMPAPPILPMVRPAFLPPPMLPMPRPASPAPRVLRPMPRPTSQAPPMLPMARPGSPAPPMLPMARPASPAPPMLRPMARPASPAEKLSVLPKSISIRSSGYTKMTRNGKHRVTKPVDVGSVRPTPSPSSIAKIGRAHV